MLKITNILGQILDLKANEVLTVESNNTLFNDSILKEDLTYPGKAPFTPPNKIFFKNAQRIDSKKETYELEVRVSVKNLTAFAGVMRLTVKKDGYEYKIKPNFSGVADRSKSYTFKDINFDDAEKFPTHANLDNLEDHMKVRAQNPDNYNSVFFPIRDESIPSAYYKIVNPYNISTNRFDLSNTRYMQPFFKLIYMLQQSWAFLGLKMQGGIYDDEEFKSHFIINDIKFLAKDNIGYTPLFSGTLSNQSAYYLPQDMLVSDFIKYVRDRFHLAYNVDYDKKTVDVTSFLQCVKTNKSVDLTQYLQYTDDQALPSQKSLRVTLLNPANNELFTDDPEKAILIGDDVEPSDIPVNIATTKAINDGTFPILYTQTPKTQVGTDLVFVSKLPASELVLAKYTGFTEAYPSAFPAPLGANDAIFYNFLNDAKQVKAVFKLPIAVLVSLKITDKITFTTKEGFTVYALIEQMNYDLSDSSFIDVEFKLRILTATNSAYRLEPEELDINTPGDRYENNDLKAYFDKGLYPNGIVIDIYYNDEPFPGGTYVYKETIAIKTPCDKFGIGGDVINIVTPLNFSGGVLQDSYRIYFTGSYSPAYYTGITGARTAMQTDGIGKWMSVAPGRMLVF